MSEFFGLGTTSSCGIDNDDFIQKYEPSNKVFHMPIITTEKASVKAKIPHNLQEP